MRNQSTFSEPCYGNEMRQYLSQDILWWISLPFLSSTIVVLIFLKSKLLRPEDMTVRPYPPEQGRRRRRAHQKSRRGCGNCKLRRVKCDETYPCCKRCSSFGVSCNYDSASDELQLAMTGTGVLPAPQPLPVSFNQLVLTMINTPPQMALSDPKTNSRYGLGLKDLEVVSRFQSRTILTLGTKENIHIFQKAWFKVACEHPMFMHVVLAMTLMHDRYVTGDTNGLHYDEAYHHYQGTVMFNRKLTDHEPGERDALWAAAALLGAMTFANIEARNYQEAWPLKLASDSDLAWLSMSDGKQQVWKLVDPMREDSVIREAWNFPVSLIPTDGVESANCPTPVELDSFRNCTVGRSACTSAATSLIPLLKTECSHSTITGYLAFMSHTEPEYRRLLREKEPVALLILAYWFAKMCSYEQWWIQPRAVLECQATCVYLDKYYNQDNRLSTLLRFPRKMSGLVCS